MAVASNLSKHALAAEDEDPLWELFHENSKTSRYEVPVSDEEVLAKMKMLWESLPFSGYPAVDLPSRLKDVRPRCQFLRAVAFDGMDPGPLHT